MINKLSSQMGVDTSQWLNFENSVLSEIRSTVEEVDPIQWLLSMADNDSGYGSTPNNSTKIPTFEDYFNSDNNNNNYTNTNNNNNTYTPTPTPMTTNYTASITTPTRNYDTSSTTSAEANLDDELAKLEAQIAAFDSGSFLKF